VCERHTPGLGRALPCYGRVWNKTWLQVLGFVSSVHQRATNAPGGVRGATTPNQDYFL